LPLGGIKVPRTGWFVVAGRRGHYQFCDSVRAYDLRTGAVFIDESCSGLVLHADGDVDRGATNARRIRRARAGVVSVDNLREAVWMLLLRGEGQEIQLRAEYYPLPAGLTPAVTVGQPAPEDTPPSFRWFTTAQTSLTWQWTPETGNSAFLGALTWPDSSDAAESHAAALLAVAEEGFVERCPAEPVQRMPRLAIAEVHNLNEVSGEEIAAFGRTLREAVQRWRRLPACPSRQR
jgi:hypothetical protein